MIDRFEITDRRTTLWLSGHITKAEGLEVVERIKAQPGYSGRTEQLIFLADDLASDATADDIRAIIKRARGEPQAHPELKVALVAGSRLAFGLSRMYEAYADNSGWQMNVFTDAEEAEAWLAA